MKRVVLLAALTLLGCGRGTASPEEDPAPVVRNDDPDPLPPDANNPEPDEQAEPPPCPVDAPSCLTGCESMFGPAAAPLCVDHAWHCPEGYVDRQSCPQGSCAFLEVSCCTPLGQRTTPECTAEGLIGSCPDGSRSYSGGACIPLLAGVDSCEQLRDGACDSLEQRCYSGKCGTNCECVQNAKGQLAWECKALLC